MKKLQGKKVAILTENGFEEIEVTNPKQALEEAGAEVFILSPQENTVTAWDSDHWSIKMNVDQNVHDAMIDEYDALFIPGGVINPDKMRMNEDCISFVKDFFDSGKPLFAICHGPQLLINAGIVKGRSLTSYPSIKIDLENAGAIWVNKEVVVDEGLVTSRSPKDLPAFNKKMIEELMEGVHER